MLENDAVEAHEKGDDADRHVDMEELCAMLDADGDDDGDGRRGEPPTVTSAPAANSSPTSPRRARPSTRDAAAGQGAEQGGPRAPRQKSGRTPAEFAQAAEAKRRSALSAALEDARALATGDAGGEAGPVVERRDVSVRDAMLRHRGKDADSLRERQAKRAKVQSGGLVVSVRADAQPSALKICGGRQGRENLYDFDDNQFAKMALRDVRMPKVAYDAHFEFSTVLDISELPDDPMAAKSGQFGDFWVFGCLVRKVARKLAKDGRKYAVWTITNMQTGTANDARAVAEGKAAARNRKTRFTSINCLLFDDAFRAWHMQVEGAVFAFHKPSILPPRESKKATDSGNSRSDDWSGVCLRVSKKDDLLPVGVCKSYALCGRVNRDGVECGAWYNKRMSSMCHRHAQEQLRKLTSSKRMDIGNQERPGLARENTVGTSGPVNVTKGVVVDRRVSERDPQEEGTRPYIVSSEEQARARGLQAKLAHVRNAKRTFGGSHMSQLGSVSTDPTEALKQAAARDRRESAARRNPDGRAELHRRSIVKTTSIPWNPRATKRKGELKQSNHDREYQEALNILLAKGFTVDSSGAVRPPSRVVLKKLGIVLQTKIAMKGDSDVAKAKKPGHKVADVPQVPINVVPPRLSRKLCGPGTQGAVGNASVPSECPKRKGRPSIDELLTRCKGDLNEHEGGHIDNAEIQNMGAFAKSPRSNAFLQTGRVGSAPCSGNGENGENGEGTESVEIELSGDDSEKED